ncbi:hypothetical protein [Nonlabens antarcticus]|uniref:hypothetical protein n=1 Tax=Nonlabens antarcticus TaxID=392714 RepID=UPI0018917CFC|nr:hypothetical protein [Nonlabens antarcticus]
MKQIFIACLTSILFIALSSCRNDFEFSESTGNLEFSQDTIFLDTVFNTIGSSTRTFKVYNRSSKDIVIQNVALAQGSNSRYRLAVDGVPGQIFENVEILARDSLYIFVETTVDIKDFSSATEFLYEDVIEFDRGGNLQEIQLVTLVKDAVFLFPKRDSQGIEETLLLGTDDENNEIRVSGFFLDDDQLQFTSDKPYVIYGFAGIPPAKILNIAAGSRLFFHSQSGIIAANEASLKINGSLSNTKDLENEVIFEGDRLEPGFNNIAGQWFGIWLTAGSKNHEITHATIKNASIGILMDSQNPDSGGATLKINNSQIYNSSNVGLLATNGNIEAENLVIHNAGQSALVARLGGSYQFNNCTITNYWNSGFRNEPTLFISNTIPDSGLSEPLSQALFTNCIIYGDRNLELGLLKIEDKPFNLKFENSIIKFDDKFDNFISNPQYDFMNTALYKNVVLNEDPLFKNPTLNMLQIDNDGGANGIANPTTSSTKDILGVLRSNIPDIGAYESVKIDF